LRLEDCLVDTVFLLLPDSKTGKKAIVLNAPAMAVLAEIPRVGTYVIAGLKAGTEDEKPRADLNRPWRAVAKRAERTRASARAPGSACRSSESCSATLKPRPR
jgi:hypothetical protein